MLPAQAAGACPNLRGQGRLRFIAPLDGRRTTTSSTASWLAVTQGEPGAGYGYQAMTHTLRTVSMVRQVPT